MRDKGEGSAAYDEGRFADLQELADTQRKRQRTLVGSAAAPAQIPVPLQRPKIQLDPGRVRKYGWEALRSLDEKTLCKEVWAVDRPAVQPTRGFSSPSWPNH